MILENSNYKVEISTAGAEMHHLWVKATQKDWIWQGDPKFWSQRNPILFPIVGSTYDKKLHFEGQITSIGNHGFARYAQFKMIHSSTTQLELELTDTVESYAQYPFHFALRVNYELHDEGLDVTYTIQNKDTVEMPFSFGLHPAFATTHNGVNGSQRIEFSHPEKQLPSSISQGAQCLEFTDEFFKHTPTFMMEYPQSTDVTLVDGNHRMTVGIVGYRWLAFWKKPEAKFLCIEPWHGHDDFEEVPQLFKDREGTLILDPGHSYTTYLQLKPQPV